MNRNTRQAEAEVEGSPLFVFLMRGDGGTLPQSEKANS